MCVAFALLAYHLNYFIKKISGHSKMFSEYVEPKLTSSQCQTRFTAKLQSS